jgi:hypothetical protein
VYIGEAIEMDLWPDSDHTTLTQEIANRLRAVSERSGLPPKRPDPIKSHSAIRTRFIALAAWWGRITHQVPIRLARSIAVKRSTNADEPAMFTIVYGVGLVLITYAIHLAIVGMIVHSFWFDCLYLAGLLSGAYWAAFQQHPRRY